MRIAVVNNFFPPRVGGSAHIADTLAQHYHKSGHEVLVITTAYKGAPEEEHRNGVRVVRVKSWTLPESDISFNFDITFGLRWGNRKRIFRLLDEFRPDVIHQHGQFFDLTWQSGWWARLRRIPTLLTLHTRLQSPMRLPHLMFRTLDAGVVRPILAYLRPNKVIAIDATFLEYIKARYRLGDDRIESVAVGVELDRFHHLDRQLESKELRERFNLGDGPVIASLGHVIPVRDRVYLVEALPSVLAAHPDTKVLVVGGVYYQRFIERARELGVANALVCTGALPKADIPGVLAGADMEIHDLQGFGVGIASLEAMAAGTPTVLAERTDYFPHAPLVDGENALLVPINNAEALAAAINKLIDDPGFARKIGEGGRQHVFANFNMPDIGDRNLDILTQLAKRKP